MITNTRKFIKKNSIESFKYDTYNLHTSYQTYINETINSKAQLFGQQKCNYTSSFSEDLEECKRQLTLLSKSDSNQYKIRQELKQKIRIFIDKLNKIRIAFIRAEFDYFIPLSQEAALQSRKHSCNMIFYNNVQKKRQEIIQYFGIDFMAFEVDEEQLITE